MSNRIQTAPTLSVIIPTKNRADLLREAIESVLRVTSLLADTVDSEVIVVDDGSIDHTAEVAANYPVRYVRNSGTGVSAARNTGIRLAVGDFVGFLDDDDVWLPGHVVPHLEVLGTSPDVALAYAQGMLADAHLNPVFPPAPKPPLPSGDVFIPFLRQCLQWNTIIVRKQVLEELGGFDEQLSSAEDWDLQMRVAAKYDCVGIPVAVTLFRQDDANFRGYGDWRDQCVQTLNVVRRSTRLPSRTSVGFNQRLFVTYGIRGWFAYRFLHSARVALANGRTQEASACLLGALRVSPVHCCFRLHGYWRTVAAALMARWVRRERLA